MEAMEALLTRRSVSSFTDRPVEKGTLVSLVRAAMHATCEEDPHPWHFLLVTERDLLNRIPEEHPFAIMALEATAAILVCAQPEVVSPTGLWFQDCAAATQNLLLAAHAQGIGGVWVPIYPHVQRMARIRALLGIPARIEPFAIVPLGYPVDRPVQVAHLDARRIHWNGWQGTEADLEAITVSRPIEPPMQTESELEFQAWLRSMDFTS
jgi:nitroreductase